MVPRFDEDNGWRPCMSARGDEVEELPGVAVGETEEFTTARLHHYEHRLTCWVPA